GLGTSVADVEIRVDETIRGGLGGAGAAIADRIAVDNSAAGAVAHALSMTESAGSPLVLSAEQSKAMMVKQLEAEASLSEWARALDSRRSAYPTRSVSAYLQTLPSGAQFGDAAAPWSWQPENFNPATISRDLSTADDGNLHT